MVLGIYTWWSHSFSICIASRRHFLRWQISRYCCCISLRSFGWMCCTPISLHMKKHSMLNVTFDFRREQKKIVWLLILPPNIQLYAHRHLLTGSHLISHQTFPADIGPIFQPLPFVQTNFWLGLFHAI